MTNQTYTLTLSSPVLRPGLTLSTEVSAGYVADAADELLELAREINGAEDVGEEPMQTAHRFEIDGDWYELIFEGDELVEVWQLGEHERVEITGEVAPLSGEHAEELIREIQREREINPGVENPCERGVLCGAYPSWEDGRYKPTCNVPGCPERPRGRFEGAAGPDLKVRACGAPYCTTRPGEHCGHARCERVGPVPRS